MDQLGHFYESLWLPIRWVISFFIGTIIVRGIIANRILLEIKQRGWLDDGILHTMTKHVKTWITVSRKAAIVSHFRDGHTHDDIVGCTEGNCAILAQSAVVRPVSV